MELSDSGDGEELAVAKGAAPSGYACDLGLSAYADDVAKKVVGRSEKELFEALEFPDKVLDEELEGGWLEEEHGQEGGRADDEGQEAGLRFKTKRARHCGGCETFGRAFHVEWQQS